MVSNQGFDITSMLNEVSRGAATQTRKKLQYTQLIPHEKNHYSLKDIDDLADSIENVGLLHDLIVKPSGEKNEDGDKLYKVVSGHRRLLAITKLVEERDLEEYATVPCVLIPVDENETVTELKLHYANTTAREMTEYDKMIAITELKQLIQKARAEGVPIKGRIKEVVADAVGLKPTQAQKYMTVAENSTEEVKEAIRDGELTIEAAHTLIKENKAKAAEKVVEKEKEVVAVSPSPVADEVGNPFVEEKLVEDNPVKTVEVEKPVLDIEHVKQMKEETPRDKVFKKLVGFEKALDRNQAEFDHYEIIKELIKKIEENFEN